MVPGWVTALVLAFGIIVGIVGVIAYLRLFRKEKLAAEHQLKADASPPVVDSGHSTSSGEIGQDENKASSDKAIKD